ncbi:MAG TPA: hypothetical protein VES93_11955 [Ornithinibacter sp.]|nr:hypothetical protein [Ornithinibacter sp.]
MGAEQWDEQVGSVADEATRLLESLRRTAEAAAQSVGEEAAAAGAPDAGDAAPGPDPAPDAAAHDPFCTWCPLCRGAAVVRSLSPQTLTRLADLAGLAATVLADLASTRSAADPPAPDGNPVDGSPEATAGATARPTPRPRRAGPAPSAPIPVRDADDPQEAPRG